MKIVIASRNQGKIKELSALLAPFHIELIPQTELGVSEIEETGVTFIENALLKARHATKTTGLPAIADDSGLTVNALAGAPGIYSARYAGEQATANDNIAKLLTDLAEVPEQKRQASFYCVLVFLAHANDPTPLVCDGRWHGSILSAPRGKQGFGYDPIFYVPTHQCSAAELERHEKNKISHRAQASACLLDWLVKQC